MRPFCQKCIGLQPSDYIHRYLKVSEYIELKNIAKHYGNPEKSGRDLLAPGM